MQKKILVTGGDGFIGMEICRIASERGYEVVSIARQGRPLLVSEPWTERVNWVAANALQPESWREHLQECDAVIHCVGIASEKPEQGITFERLNDDATEVVAWEAEHAGVPRFVFLSAATDLPFISHRFIESKRRAENALRGRAIRESILRPAFVYGPRRPSSMAVARILQTAEKLPLLKHRLRRIHPLRVEQVATAAVRAATEDGYEGIINLDNIEFLAGNVWTVYLNGRHTANSASKTPVLLAAAATGLLLGAGWKFLRRK